MEYKLGNSKIIKSRGESFELVCPHCNKKTNFGVFSNYERRLIAKMPLVDCNTVYFLICPQCSAIYTVDREIGDKFRKNDKAVLSPDLLKPLEEYKA